MPSICKSWIFYISAISAILIFVARGITMGWKSPMLVKLRSNDSSINPLETPITVIQISISTSLFSIGGVIAPLLMSKLLDVVGRRTIMIYIAAIAMVAYCMMVFVTSFWMYVTFYFMISLCITLAAIVVPIYLSEISEVHNRGIFTSVVNVGQNLGLIYATAVGPIIKFGTFSVCSGIPLLLFLLMSFFTQESPIFLYLRGNKKGAIQSIKKLRRYKNPTEIENEIKEKEEILEGDKKKSSLKILFHTQAGKKALYLSIMLRLLLTLSGQFVVEFYLGPLSNEAGSEMSGYTVSIIAIMVRLISTSISSSLVDKIGRKILVLVGSFGCGLAMFGLGVYFYFKENQIEFPPHFRILPIVCLLTFYFSFAFGIGGVASLIISELLPNESRGNGTSTIIFLCNIVSVVKTFSYPLIVHNFGTYYAMFVLSLFSCTGFVFVLIFLPETKGKTFAQIQSMLAGNNYR